MTIRRGPTAGRRARATAALCTTVLLTALGAAGGAPGALAQEDDAPGTPLWSLAGGAGPLSVVDRNDYDEQSGHPRVLGRSLQFTVPGGEQRSEVRPRVPRSVENTIQDVTYRARLAPDFPADADGWQIILQWHQSSDEGSPPLAVEINKGRLLLDNGETQQTEIGRVKPGDALDLRLRVLFSKDSGKGSVDLWNDGRHVLTGDHPPEGTLQDDGRNYMKTGIYRSKSLDEDASLTLDTLEVATGTVGSPPPVTGLAPRAPAPATSPTRTSPAPSARPAPGSDDGGSWWLPVGVVAVLVVGGGAAVAVARRRRDQHSSR